MEKKKLLIADGTEEFRLALSEALQEAYHVRSCKSGKEALSILHSYHPDVLVLDLMLPELDGISLLQSASAAGICPMVLATTRFISDYVTESINYLGIQYLMVKPCDIRATIDRIRDLSKRIHRIDPAPEDPKLRISGILLSLGMPAKLNGYDYLQVAILQIARHPGQAVTKELYPHVAAVFGVDKANVERSMRNAIAAAWAHRDEQVWLQYFPADADGVLHRPTNSTFICQLAKALQLNPDNEKN